VECEVWADRWVEGEGKGGSIGFEFARGMSEKVRGEYSQPLLMKPKKRGKICFVIHIAGERFFFIIYAVIVKHFFCKRSTNHYLHVHGVPTCSSGKDRVENK
jgi:hypothetical protein